MGCFTQYSHFSPSKLPQRKHYYFLRIPPPHTHTWSDSLLVKARFLNVPDTMQVHLTPKAVLSSVYMT